MITPTDHTRFIRRCLLALTVFSMGSYLLCYAVINIWGFPLYCNTDMYADTLVARLIWEEKSLFPEGWIFSNQYYAAATPVLAALFYGITGNVNTAMVLATQLMTLFILLSLWYLIRGFSRDPLWYFAACLALMASTIAPDLPENRPAQIFFLMCSYYACYLITFFLVVGDYVRSRTDGRKRWGSWGLALALSYAMGIQSLRQTAAMTLPILACELFLALRRKCQGQRFWPKEALPSLVRCLSYLGANLLGLATTAWIDPLHTAVYGQTSLTPLSQILPKIQALWPAFQVISGLQYGEDSLFLAFLSLFFIAIVLAAALLWLRRIRRPETALELSWLVCLVGLVATALSTVVTGVKIRHIYLFLWYPLVVLSLLMVMEKLAVPGKMLLIAALCLLSLGNLTHGYTLCAENALQNSPGYAGKAFRLARAYGYHSYAETSEDFVSSRQLCQWAMDQGYEYVYGDWYVAPRIAVHSGGKLTAGYWWGSSMLQANDHLTSLSFYAPENNAKAIYVLTPQDEDAFLSLARSQGAEPEKVAAFGIYHAYTSQIPLIRKPTI